MNISKSNVEEFYQTLLQKEHSRHTAEKYRRDALGLVVWLNGAELTKEKALAYKQTLMENYQVRSVNSMLSSVNAFFAFLGRQDLQLKTLKLQRQTYLTKEKELTKGEYEKLVKAAKENKDERLYYLIQTICATGIRVSELAAITVESLKERQATINCKGKLICPKKKNSPKASTKNWSKPQRKIRMTDCII